MKHNTTTAAAAKTAAAANTTTANTAAANVPALVMRTPNAAHKRAASAACAALACADHAAAVAACLATFESVRALKAQRAAVLASTNTDASAWNTLRTAFAHALADTIASEAADAADALSYKNTMCDAWKRLRAAKGFNALCARVDAAYNADVFAFVYACAPYANAAATRADAPDALLRVGTYAVVLDADTDAPTVCRVRVLVPRACETMRDAAAVLTNALTRFVRRVGKHANAKTDKAAAVTANTYAPYYVTAVDVYKPAAVVNPDGSTSDAYTPADADTFARAAEHVRSADALADAPTWAAFVRVNA